MFQTEPVQSIVSNRTRAGVATTEGSRRDFFITLLIVTVPECFRQGFRLDGWGQQPLPVALSGEQAFVFLRLPVHSIMLTIPSLFLHLKQGH